jgi:SAM-dependent methyltransferase
MTGPVTPLSEELLSALLPEEARWLSAVLERFGNRLPRIDQLWALMDEVWRELGCDPRRLDERVTRFYAHPVWLLNGLFVESDPQSLAHRTAFVAWVATKRPRRVADYGGGFGTLARMLGRALPDTDIEVIEPYPHPVAVELARRTSNVRYCSSLTGEYDVLLATDVFEHVSDPLGLAVETSRSLRSGGVYLIANCFRPVILCHLPQHFHFEHSWVYALARAGLTPRETVVYGRAFERHSSLDLAAGREVEYRSRRLYRWTRPLPGRVRSLVSRVVLGHDLTRR